MLFIILDGLELNTSRVMLQMEGQERKKYRKNHSRSFQKKPYTLVNWVLCELGFNVLTQSRVSGAT